MARLACCAASCSCLAFALSSSSRLRLKSLSEVKPTVFSTKASATRSCCFASNWNELKNITVKSKKKNVFYLCIQFSVASNVPSKLRFKATTCTQCFQQHVPRFLFFQVLSRLFGHFFLLLFALLNVHFCIAFDFVGLRCLSFQAHCQFFGLFVHWHKQQTNSLMRSTRNHNLNVVFESRHRHTLRLMFNNTKKIGKKKGDWSMSIAIVGVCRFLYWYVAICFTARLVAAGDCWAAESRANAARRRTSRRAPRRRWRAWLDRRPAAPRPSPAPRAPDCS